MKIAQLETLIIENAVAKVVLRHLPTLHWELWAYDHDDDNAVSRFGNRLYINREDLKLFESLDEAYQWLRDRKYTRNITVEG